MPHIELPRLHAFILGLLVALAAFTASAAADHSRLIDAVKAGDHAGVRALVQQHTDVNGRAAAGSTALYWAAQRNDVDIAAMLIRAGADVNARSRYGVTPL